MALQWADMLSEKYRVGFFSLETKAEKLADRLVAMKAAVSLSNIKQRKLTARDSDKICEVVAAVDNQCMDIIPMASITAPDIERIATENQYQVIFIDYVQIIESIGRSEAEEIANAAKSLQQMAKRNNLLIVGLSQLTEDNMSNGYEPFNHSLRGSRALEHTADIILLMYLADKKKQKGNRIMKVSKNKDGETKKIELEFDGPCQTFRKAAPKPLTSSQRDRRKLIKDAVEAGKNISLCMVCAKKMEDGYIVTKIPDRHGRNVDCWLCGQRLFGGDFVLDKEMPEETNS